MLKRILLFLLINFGALALGSFLMGNPATNEWYKQLDKAPWTPPGWVFGAAWFSIMTLFSIFMARVTQLQSRKKQWLFIFGIQFLLNVSWNPVFFRFHYVVFGLIVLLMLIVILLWMLVLGYKQDKWSIIFLLPYILWLGIALSLNAYVI